MPYAPKTHRQTSAKVRESERRKQRGPRYYDTARWKKLRRMVLRRDPICVLCNLNGFVVPSRHADHVLALEAGGTNEMKNLRGLCPSCHSRKTALEDGGFGS